MKKSIEVFDYANVILKEMKKGIFLTTQSGDKTNSMVISWGSLGIQWAKPIFIVYVRENRYTKKLLDENPEFTINVPYGDYDKNIFKVCGTQSGLNVDKFKELGLTAIDGEKVSVPAIKELPLTLECKVIYKQAQDPNNITEENKAKFYPQDVDGSFHGANKDYHTVYYGEIVNAYIVE